MRYRKKSSASPDVDPAFAEALSGKSESTGRNRNQIYKAQQLCRQVQCALSLALAGDPDDLLRDVYVAQVTAFPGSSQLLVHVTVPKDVGIVELLEHLDRAAPRLRAEVAQAITRKRAPELAFIPTANVEGDTP